MKQTFFFLLLTILHLSFVDNSETISLQDGLVAHYNFNDCDARDISGNGSDGLLFGEITCWCGIENDGLLLDGINDYIEFHGIVNRYFTTSDFTLSYFIRTDQYSFYQQSLFSKRENCGKDFVLDFLLNRNQKKIETSVQQNEYKKYKDISLDIEGGGWYHITLVREGQEAHSYINGILQKSVMRCSGVDLSNDAILSFSNSPCLDGKVQRFKGILDEVRVYDRAISEQEVETIYSLTPIEKIYSDCIF